MRPLSELEEFKVPSLSLLKKKLTSGKIDPVTSFKARKENGSISEDVMLLFDEMYLQKCEEYTLAVKRCTLQGSGLFQDYRPEKQHIIYNKYRSREINS